MVPNIPNSSHPLLQGLSQILNHIWFQFLHNISRIVRNIFPAYNDNETVWDDLRFPATQAKLPGVSDPTYDATNICYSFSASQDNRLDFIAQLPHEWKPGTNIRPHIHYRGNSASNGNIVFRVDAQWYNSNEQPGNDYAVQGNANISTANFLNYAVFPFGDFIPTNHTESSIMKFTFQRLGTDPGDTYTGTVLFDEFDIHYQKEKLGTSNYSPSRTLNLG